MIRSRLVYVLSIFVISTIAVAAKPVEPTLKEIMQGLRDQLVEISDGLLTDDFDRVAHAAVEIARHAPISQSQRQLIAAELGLEMAGFKQLDQLVHELSLSMTTAANEQDRETVIADFQRMINGCLGCHTAYKDRVAAALSRTADR